MDNYHLRKNGEVWKLKKEGSERAHKMFDTKKDGMDYSNYYAGGKRRIFEDPKRGWHFPRRADHPHSKDPKNHKTRLVHLTKEGMVVPVLSLTSHTTLQVSRLPGILAGGEPWSS